MNHIRNFSIIAHIDHGKSTLADRIIQICGGLSSREIKAQVLDSMTIERERGITIKAHNVALNYKSTNGQNYQLNFIDTPGHVDFSYEVSRSLSACEGALLIVDAGQGIEAQTIANYYTAIEMNLKVITALNKIDLPAANIERVKREIKDIIGIDANDIELCSAKTGAGVINILERLVHYIPAPKGNSDEALQALIIDSWFDSYLGVVSLVRIKNGVIRKGDKIKVMSTGQVYSVNRLGIFTPKKIDLIELKCGRIGWLVCAIKDILFAPVGDTLTGADNPASKALSGFKKVKPQIYASLFPVSSDDHKNFHNALSKLSLNDASLSYVPENSTVLGCGFRCGFLGMLHLEIIQERLKREYNLCIVTTEPTVVYEVRTTNKEVIYINNPSNLPPLNNIKEILEPIAECQILIPSEYLGNVIKLCVEKRGIQTKMVYHGKHIALTYEIPMAEVIMNLFDRLKSTSRGYASLDYKFKHFQVSKIVKIDILINGERIDALALITHHDNAQYRSKELVEKIRNIISRQQFNITIQAAIGNHIISSATVKQLRKNVLAKCSGGDVSRKKKLLQKQKEGKKRMKQISKVELSQSILLNILSLKRITK